MHTEAGRGQLEEAFEFHLNQPLVQAVDPDCFKCFLSASAGFIFPIVRLTLVQNTRALCHLYDNDYFDLVFVYRAQAFSIFSVSVGSNDHAER